MFHSVSNASKAAVLFAVAMLKRAGRTYMDIQVMSEHMKAMGAHEISRSQFQKRLTNAQDLIKKCGPSLPFADKIEFRYCDFSSNIV